MILTVENAPDFERDFQTAFEVCQRELGLDCLWGNLHVQLAPLEKGRNGQILNYLGPRNSMLMRINDQQCTCSTHSRLTKKEFLVEVFCHEVVHAKQIRTGELKISHDRFGDEKAINWKGQDYPAQLLMVAMSHNSLYRSLPWEQEAFGKEAFLFKKVMEKIKARSGQSKVYA